MTIEKLWEAACCGENEKLIKYFSNGGKVNQRYNKFGKAHSLIAGAYRNGNFETVDLLYTYGEQPEAHEMDKIGFIPGYAVVTYKADGKRQYTAFESKENAYTIFNCMEKIAVDKKENIKALAILKNNVIMEKVNY